MSHDLLKSQIDLLKILGKPNSRYRKAIIENADKDLILVLCGLIDDILTGRVKISDNDKEKLKKFRSTLHALVQKSSLRTKKRILLQKGGFLEVLIPR